MKLYHFLLLCIISNVIASDKKIVGLVSVKNEQNNIEQCLHALSLYTDSIVILDDVSQDNTPAILQQYKDAYNLHIITKKQWHRDEAKDRNLMLQCGRAMGGTHFIIIDADEMFTAPCKHGEHLRNAILRLEPGDWLSCFWINLYEHAQHYDDNNYIKPFIFCDDKVAQYNNNMRIHAARIPEGLSGREYVLEPTSQYGLLHFKFINWDNVLLRNAWYQCLTVIMWPEISRKEIGAFYAQKLVEQAGNLVKTNPQWFDYDFFDLTDFEKPDSWRRKQIQEWMTEYGAEYFADLSISQLNLEES